MRFASFLLAATLISSAAYAAEPPAKVPVFGRANCGQAFQCEVVMGSEKNRTMLPAVIAIAKGCIASNFGMSSGSGYFEESLGLDSSGCLTTKTLPKPAIGLTMSPRCCVVPTAGDRDVCQVECTLYGLGS